MDLPTTEIIEPKIKAYGTVANLVAVFLTLKPHLDASYRKSSLADMEMIVEVFKIFPGILTKISTVSFQISV